MTVNWNELRAVIDAATKINLTSHIRPDCDALGSELGMACVLRQMGKQVRIVNGQATPPNLAFIDPDQEIRVIGTDVAADDLMDADLWMILDTSAWEQLGPMREVFGQFTGAR